MRYAIYLSANPMGREPEDDYFCVLERRDDIILQIEEFRSWDDDDIEDFDEMKQLLLFASDQPITLKGTFNAICIRPIKDE